MTERERDLNVKRMWQVWSDWKVKRVIEWSALHDQVNDRVERMRKEMLEREKECADGSWMGKGKRQKKVDKIKEKMGLGQILLGVVKKMCKTEKNGEDKKNKDIYVVKPSAPMTQEMEGRNSLYPDLPPGPHPDPPPYSSESNPFTTSSSSQIKSPDHQDSKPGIIASIFHFKGEIKTKTLNALFRFSESSNSCLGYFIIFCN